jgi:hypothetical protein
MWIVAIAWMYVALMMAVSEAVSPVGSVLGAIITLLFYGVLPTALVMYVLGTPQRRRARLARQTAEEAAEPATHNDPGAQASRTTAPLTRADGDGGSLSTGDTVSAERKETR